MADGFGIDLIGEVRAKIAAATVRDHRRFGQSFDPSTASSVTAFRTVSNSSPCTFAAAAKLWGAPDWAASQKTASNVDLLVPHLAAFTKAAAPEGLDAFIIKPTWSHLDTMGQLANKFRELLTLIASRDPAKANVMAGPIDVPGWQFSFNGTRLFVSVFSSLYAETHPRHCPSGSFVVLQPEQSFMQRGIGGGSGQTEAIKGHIREKFERAGFTYPHSVIDARIEAAIYLLPRFEGETLRLFGGGRSASEKPS